MATKKRTTTKTTKTTKTAKSRTGKSVSSTKNPMLGIVAVVAGVSILLGVLFTLYSNAASKTYVTSDGQTVVRRFPGDPNPKVTKKAYWGAGIAGNGDPVRHEGPTGVSLSVRRTFWGWDNNRTSMISTIKADLAANRLPYVSTKTPKWSEVAAGQHDAALDDMLKKVDATGGPVWLTFWHEPEDDTETATKSEKCNTDPNHAPCSGTAADWRNMQKHVRDRMNALGTKNIAFMPTLMAWTFDPGSKRTATDYWVDGIWDAYMSDAYCDWNCADKGQAPSNMTQWVNFSKFAESRNMPHGTGEWGNRYADAAAAQEMLDFWNWGFKNNKDVIAYSYFDSGLNSDSGSWELLGEPLKMFQNILKNGSTSGKVQRINDLGTLTTSTTVSPSSPPPTTTVTTTVSPSTGALSINITNPLAGSTVKGVVNVTAAPDTNVQEVSFRLDDKWQTTDSSSPFSWSWDTTTVADGAHTLTIRARKVGDPGDVYTEKSIKVTVKNSATTNWWSKQ